MQLDWTTFALEMVNFLILVWILNHFLYRPVREVILKRQAQVQATLAEADKKQIDAGALQQQYQHRLEEWQKEREGLRNDLQEEISRERARLLDALQLSLDEEREKNRAMEQRRLAELEGTLLKKATAQSLQFTARLLESVAGPDLDARLADHASRHLQVLCSEQRGSLREALQRPECLVHVVSAYPLPAAQRSRFEEELHAIADRKIPCEYSEDPSLISGIRASIGPYVLRANLQDELKYFVEALNHET
jgi:F-type H+-transporting ATPase subunit b